MMGEPIQVQETSGANKLQCFAMYIPEGKQNVRICTADNACLASAWLCLLPFYKAPAAFESFSASGAH
jgi:hypothetical protein